MKFFLVLQKEFRKSEIGFYSYIHGPFEDDQAMKAAMAEYAQQYTEAEQYFFVLEGQIVSARKLPQETKIEFEKSESTNPAQPTSSDEKLEGKKRPGRI